MGLSRKHSYSTPAGCPARSRPVLVCAISPTHPCILLLFLRDVIPKPVAIYPSVSNVQIAGGPPDFSPPGVNQLLQCPGSRTNGSVLLALPESSTCLPRLAVGEALILEVSRRPAEQVQFYLQFSDHHVEPRQL